MKHDQEHDLVIPDTEVIPRLISSVRKDASNTAADYFAPVTYVYRTARNALRKQGDTAIEVNTDQKDHRE